MVDTADITTIETEDVYRVTPRVNDFLNRWDRGLTEDRRVYGIKLLFSGGESKKLRDGLYRVGVRHLLISYFYGRSWLKTNPLQVIAEDLGRFDFVFLSSGNFTLRKNIQKCEENLGISIKEYAEEYYREMERIGTIFAGFSDLDLPELANNQEITTLRKGCLEKKLPLVPIVNEQTADELEAMGWYEDYPYIGIGSAIIQDSTSRNRLSKIIDRGKKFGTLFHVFGTTDIKTISGRRFPFYSVDSATYLNGKRYGKTIIFQNGRLRYYDNTQKSIRNRYKQRLVENGIIWEDVENDKGLEAALINAVAYRQYLEYLKYNIASVYWLTPDERDKVVDLRSKAFNSEGLIDRKASIARAQFRRLSETDAREDDRGQETLYCDTCYLTGRCPRYKSGQSCGYDINIRLETRADLNLALRSILEAQYGRVMTAVLFEKAEGGNLDRNVSEEMKKFLGMIKDLKDLFDTREEITIQAKGGKGSVSQMLASVFRPGGSPGITTQRSASRLEEKAVLELDGEIIKE